MTHTRSCSALLTLGLLLVTALAASGQTPPPVPKSPHRLATLDWPGGLGTTGPFIRTEAGEFTGDLIPDVAFLYGRVPVLIYGPHVHASFSEVVDASYEVNDIATWPGGGYAGKDAILMARSGGIERARFDEQLDLFDIDVIESSTWLDVQIVRSVDWDKDDDHDILGLFPSRREVRVLNNTPSGFVAGHSFATSHDISDFVVMDWNADTELDLVCLTDDGLRIFPLDGGGRFPDVRLAHPGGQIAVLPQEEGSVGDRLAWITRAPNNLVSLLLVMDFYNADAPVILTFPILTPGVPIDIEILHLRSADADADGDHDLLIATTTAQRCIVLANRWTVGTEQPRFSSSEGDFFFFDLSLTPLAPSSTNIARPCFADLDGDLTGDVFYPVDTEDGFVQIFGLDEVINGRGGTEGLQVDLLGPYCDFGVVPGKDGDLHIVFDIPFEYWDRYSHLQVMVWEQMNPGEDIDRFAIHNEVFELSGVEYNPNHWVTVGGFPQGNFWPNPRWHFYVQVRFVNWGPQETEASPSFLAGFTLRDTNVNPDPELYLAYLESQPNAGRRVSLWEGPGPPPPGPPGGPEQGNTFVGAFVVQDIMPPTGTDMPPHPGETVDNGTVTGFWDENYVRPY